MASNETQQTEDEQIIREYECGYLLLPTITPENVTNEAEQLKTIIQDNGGRIANSQAPSKFPLAYTMSISREGSRDSYTEAYFGWITFEADSQQVNDIKEALRVNESLLRYMVVKADKDQEPEEMVAEEELSEEADSDEQGAVATSSAEEVSEKELDKSIDGMVEKGEENAPS